MARPAAMKTLRTVPRTILATLAACEDDALFVAEAVTVAVGGSVTVFAAKGMEVVEVESVAGVDAKSVGFDDTGGDVVEDDSAFWFQVMASGWVGSWLIWKIAPVTFLWPPTGST